MLNTDNAEAAQRKRKRIEKPAETKPVLLAKKPANTPAVTADVEMKKAKDEVEAEDSYEFEPVCHNCSG